MAVAVHSLTVSESKRLIAKGVAQLPSVRRAMGKGLIAVCKGTTNAYVLEELLGQSIQKTGYVLGATIPVKGAARASLLPGSIPEVILRDGRPADDLPTVQDAFKVMGRGDLVIKGANALDYDRKLAGVLIGHPEGGTVGGFIGRMHGRKFGLLIPVGLEKQVAGDLRAAEVDLLSAGPDRYTGPSLWVIHGEIFSEIEALRLLTGAEATQIGSGGIGGAEGAVWLLVKGTAEEVGAATALIESIHGEPPFTEH
ncbi:MAG: hypothetical protein FJX74_01325 [Armatimonadetes bacterium]|nr:hypothetical protein [Armatimonadota bacterium]